MHLKKIKLILLLFLVTTAIESVPAQEKVIAEAVFNAIVEKGYDKLKNEKYRVVKISERKDWTGDQIDKKISEYLPPDRERHIIETRNADSIKQIERIHIGDVFYVKFGDGEWQIEGIHGSGGGNGFGSSNMKITRLIKYLGESIMNGKTANLYEDKTVTVTELKVGKVTTTKVNRYWFDKKERILKTDSETTEDKTLGSYRTSSEYDYDAEIKIEVPIIKKKQ